MTKRKVMIGAAIAGLIVAGSVVSVSSAQAADDAHAEKNSCKGKDAKADKNSCKGKEAKKKAADKNACSGKNGCSAKADEAKTESK